MTMQTDTTYLVPPDSGEMQFATLTQKQVTTVFSPQNIALAVTAILSILGYIFHTNVGDLAGPITTAATAIIAAAIAIENAIKFRSTQQYNASMRSLDLQEMKASREYIDNPRLLNTIAGYFEAQDKQFEAKLAAATTKPPRAPRTVTVKRVPAKRPVARRTTKRR
jgi:hypothetical protein